MFSDQITECGHWAREDPEPLARDPQEDGEALTQKPQTTELPHVAVCSSVLPPSTEAGHL